MRRAISKHARDFAWVVGLVIVGVVVGGIILKNQRLLLPSWVPFVGSDNVERSFVLQTAQAFTPGQGQEVNIAGIKVGEVKRVELENGRGVVKVTMEREYAERMRRDATALVRPKTGLQDMTIQVDPGTRAAPPIGEDEAVPVGQTLGNVNFEEVLTALDADTRDYLRLLLAGGGEGVEGNADRLGNALRRFEPIGRDTERITRLLSERSENISRGISNLRRFADALGNKDEELGQLIDASSAVFRSFRNQDRRLRAALQELPSGLRATRSALGSADRLAVTLGPSLERLRPFARALGPAQRASRPFFRETTPIIRDQVRPFARTALPVARELTPAADDIAHTNPDVNRSVSVLNEAFNTLAFDPQGPDQGYLFYLSWLAHNAASMYTGQDAHGPIRRGVSYVACEALGTFNRIANGAGQSATNARLLNTAREACLEPANLANASASAQGGIEEEPNTAAPDDADAAGTTTETTP